MRKLVIMDDTKHKCNLCGNKSEIKFIKKNIFCKVTKLKVKGYLCDDCFENLIREVLEEYETEDKNEQDN